MNIVVFGVGYVGLVAGVCFASMGNSVVCIDTDENKINQLKKGNSSIYEPGIEKMLQEGIQAKKLSFTTESNIAIEQAQIIFIAVGTPADNSGNVDLKYVDKVANTIAKYIKQYVLIVNKSTVPVGSADRVSNIVHQVLKERNIKISFDVTSNPEFLKEGSAIKDFMWPDRIIIGTSSLHAEKILRELYKPFNRNHDKLLVMDTRSAELTKYVSNTMLASRISLMNEMSHIAEKSGADIELVRLGVGADHRIGYDFIYPGCGYGGSCFPKDIKALQHMARKYKVKSYLIDSIEKTNSVQKNILFDKMEQHFKDLSGKKFAIWGLSFKPNTDDIRESPALVLIEKLWKTGAIVQCYDPVAMNNFANYYGETKKYKLCVNPQEALRDADALVILTEWSIFRSPNISDIKNELKNPIIFDGRNLYDRKLMIDNKIIYYSIGRPAIGIIPVIENNNENT